MDSYELMPEVNNAKPKPNVGKIVAILSIIIGIVIFVAVISSQNGGSLSYLNYDNYTKIKNGMTYQEVVEILDNHQGTLDTSSSYGGYTLSYYSWSNSSGTRCIVVGFENGKVCAKSQYGL